MIVFHSGAILVLSFLVSGAGNVLAQLFYQRHHPEQKVLMLGVCLFAGALGSTAGVLASNRGRITRAQALPAIAATLSAAAGLLLVRGAWVYVAVNASMQLGSNFLVNHLDHAAVARAGDEKRKLNDAVSNLARLLGMLAGPPVFTALYDHRAALYAMLGAMAALALASAAALLSGKGPRPTVSAPGVAAAAVDRADRLFFAYAVAVYAGLYLLAANLIYILRDVLKVEGAEGRGATTIMLVFLAAVLGNAGASALLSKRDRTAPSATLLIIPAVLLVIEAAVLGSGVRVPFEAVVAGAVALGFTYGAFLVEVRGYASRGARAGKRALLTFFNNMANLSALVAFASMTALVAIGKATGGSVYGWVLGLIGVLPMIGLPMLLASLGAKQRTAVA